MGCKECEKIQDLALNKNIPESTPICYIRVGTANVAIIGCNKHLLELMNNLKKEGKQNEKEE